MIVVRDIFQLRFGQSKEATQLWKQAVAVLRSSGFTGQNMRLLTDLAGNPYYTIVLESTHDSLAAWERSHETVGKRPEWRIIYEQIIALTQSGRREILSVIE